MALVELPKELLLMVTDHLPVRSIESLALTFNHQITPLCIPLLKPLLARRARIKHLIDVFGEFRFNQPFETEDLLKVGFAKLGISAEVELGELTASERLRRLEYLDLKEDFYWLKPLDKDTAKRIREHETLTILEADELVALQADAASVNITLPPSFVKFCTSWKYVTRIPSCTANFFRFEGGLRKVRSNVDKGLGGYSLSIYSDQQGCGYWSLYLQPGLEGTHCVLASSWDSGMDMEPEVADDDYSENDRFDPNGELDAQGNRREMAQMFRDDIIMEGISFEEWLATTYYEQRLWYFCNDLADEPDEDLKKYARRMYLGEDA